MRVRLEIDDDCPDGGGSGVDLGDLLRRLDTLTSEGRRAHTAQMGMLRKILQALKPDAPGPQIPGSIILHAETPINEE